MEEDNNVLEKYNAWDNKLQEEYVHIFKTEEYIKDGVIDPQLYYDSDIKVMFLNREANEGNEAQDYSYSYAIKEQIEEGYEILPISRFRKSLKNDLVVAYCLRHPHFPNITYEEFVDILSHFEERNFENGILRSALCNVKKVSGGSKVKWYEVTDHFNKGKEILFEQIKFYNPTIIFTGNLVDKILDVCDSRLVWGKTIDERGEKRHIYVCEMELDGKIYPIVDLYHPSYWSVKDDYWWEVLELVQKVEKEHPDYWKSHMNQPCFE